MTSRMLVTGGTGTLGKLTVPRLRNADNEITILSRRERPAAEGIRYAVGDLIKNEGVERAVGDAETVVHLAGGPRRDEVATANLMRAAARAGVRHVVFISVVGADQVPFGYFRSKLSSERIVSTSGVPWTTLRATQFHDLVLKVAQAMSKLPVMPIPSGARFQPIDAGEVAERIAELAVGELSGLVEDMAGPRIYGMDELMRGYLKAVGRHRPLVTVWLPGKGMRALRAGGNLAPQRAVGHRTWEEFLAERAGAIRG